MINRHDEPQAMMRRILPEALAILRDDKPFDPLDSIFGKLMDTAPHECFRGVTYIF